MSETLTIVLRADGSGLTGTVRTAAGEVRQFGTSLDQQGRSARRAGEENRRASRQVRQVGTESATATTKVQGLARGLGSLQGVLATLGVTMLVRNLAQAGLEMDRLERATAAALGSQAAGARELAFIREEAERLGLYLPTLVQGYAGLAAATRGTRMEGQLTREIFLSVAEAGRAMNLSNEQVAGVLTALQQIAGKGTVSMEELRQQLGDRLPGAMQIAAKSMNMTVAELVKMVSNGELLSEEFLPKFAVALREAMAAGVELSRNSPAAEFDRLRTALFEAGAQFARGGILQGMGKSAGELADTIRGLVDSGWFERLAALTITLVKVTITWFAVYKGIPAVVAGLKLIHAQYVAIQASAWGMAAATQAGVAASIKSIGLLSATLGTLFSAIAGWQLGTYLRENFLEAELAGIAFVRGTLVVWERLKLAGNLLWAAFKAAFQGAINTAKDGLASFLGAFATAAEVIPDWFGGEKLAGSLRELESSLRPTSSAAEDFTAEVARLTTESMAAEAQIVRTTDEMADYAIEQSLSARATAAAAAEEAGLATALGATTEMSEEAAAAARRLAQARRDFVRESAQMQAQLLPEEFGIQQDYSMAVADAMAAFDAGVATADQLEYRLDLLGKLRDAALADVAAERERADAVLQAQAALEQDIYLAWFSRREREIERQVMEAVNQAYQDSIQLRDASLALDDQEVANLRAIYTQRQELAELLEQHERQAETYRRMWDGAIDSVASSFGDWLTSANEQYRGFGRELKDITRRFLSDIVAEFARDQVLQPIRNWFRQLMSGGFAQAGGGAGGSGFGDVIGALFGGGGGGGAGGWMANVGQAVRGWLGGTASGPQAGGMATATAGSLIGFGNIGNLAGIAGGSIQPVGGAVGGNQLVEIAGQLYSVGGTKTGGAFLQSAAAPWLAGAAGAVYGWKQGGDTAGKALGAAAYGAAGYGVMAGVGGAMAGSAVAGSAAAGLAAVPVVGWIALAAIAIDKLSGGKLFGTKFKPESASMDLAFGADGASGSTTLTEVRNRSLFRGRKWRTTVEDLDPEAQAALDEAWSAINDSVAQAAAQLGVATPELIAGSFRQEFDGKGNLQREFSTIAGRVYQEAEEAFTQRLVAENLLNVAGQVGSRAEINRIAERFRGSPEDLTEFATLALAMQADIKNATALWDSTVAGSFDRIVRSMEQLGQGSEQLAETYARLTGTARQYGALIGDVRGQLATADLNDYQRAQLDIELGYRNQVRQANELAKALGLSGARAEDLAAIEQLRALNMATLQRQQEAQRDNWLEDLGLSDLSTLRDDQKLSESMKLLRAAVGAGDLQRAQQLGQTALGFGRSLYASGADYAAVYDQVTSLIESIAPGDELGFEDAELTRIADLLEDLPQRLATEVFAQVLAPPPAPITPWTPPVPATPPGGGTGGGGGSNDQLLRELREMNARLAAIEGNTGKSATTAARDLRQKSTNRHQVVQ